LSFSGTLSGTRAGRFKVIVILHGMPSDGGKQRAHQISRFVENFTVPIAAWPDLSFCKRMYGDNVRLATVHNLTFRFAYHDGTNYHYRFTGEID
jgi:hypothetical protein